MPKNINLQSFKSSTMPLKEGSYKPYSEVVIGSIIYGTIGVFLDKVQDMSIESILFSRFFFGFGMIFIYLLLSRGLRQLRLRKNRRYLMLLALLNSITSICYFSSIKYSGISVAVLLLYTAPVYVNLLAPTILGEQNSRKSLLPLLLAAAGVLLIAHYNHGPLLKTWLQRDNSDILDDWDKSSHYASSCTFHPSSPFL